MPPHTISPPLAPPPDRATDLRQEQTPSQSRHPHSGDHVVRVTLQNPLAFLGRLHISPVSHQEEQQVIPEFQAAGLAGDQPAELRLFIGNVYLVSALPSHKIARSLVTLRGLAEGSALPEFSHALEAARAQQQSAAGIEKQARRRTPAALTWTVLGFQHLLAFVIHRIVSAPSPSGDSCPSSYETGCSGLRPGATGECTGRSTPVPSACPRSRGSGLDRTGRM